jgi:hypothetical protein
MTQKEIDIQEWKNPDNWSDGFFKAYFSKKDSRVFVPSRIFQWWGESPHFVFNPSTINMGHRRGAMWSMIIWGIICIAFFVLALGSAIFGQ